MSRIVIDVSDDGELRVDPQDEGGDPVCWIDQVCPDCGRLVGEGITQCPFCDARTDDGSVSPREEV